MEVIITPESATFKAGEKTAGLYVLNDRFKPYFAQLNAPAGHNVVLVSPGDHRHHKGLMYALRAEDLNFWEEEPGTGHCGVQEIVSTRAVNSGIEQEILWREEGGHLETYREIRSITCEAKGPGFSWTWTTNRTALRDHKLIQSEWAHAAQDGRVINYHGIGIRPPWMWSFGSADGCAFGTLEVDGKPESEKNAHGTTAAKVGIWGIIDGDWNAPKARLTLSQDHGFPWYMIRGDFAYIATGPSGAGPVVVSRGDTFIETYHVSVEDISED